MGQAATTVGGCVGCLQRQCLPWWAGPLLFFLSPFRLPSFFSGLYYMQHYAPPFFKFSCTCMRASACAIQCKHQYTLVCVRLCPCLCLCAWVFIWFNEYVLALCACLCICKWIQAIVYVHEPYALALCYANSCVCSCICVYVHVCVGNP